MPWEKSFDMDTALAGAMRVFWRKGYEATSISDLLKGMQINKGSFYNAFESKQNVFLQALLKYDNDNRKATLAALSDVGNPLEAIRTLFDAIVDESANDPEQKGCLLVNTALDMQNLTPQIQKQVQDSLDEFEVFFRERLRTAQQQGLVSKGFDVDGDAAYLLSQVVGIRVLARGARDRAQLQTIADQTLRKVA